MFPAIFKAIRFCGHTLEHAGRALETNPYVEKLQPCIRAVKLGNKIPTINGAFVAPTASVIGNVEIGNSSAIWYGAVVRGDVNTVKIGKNVTIGDGAMVHCSSGHPTIIGDRVIVNSRAIIHGCTLGEECVVGMGAQVMDGAKIEKQGMLAAGGLLSAGKVIPSGECWAGIPAVFQKNLSKAEIDAIGELTEDNTELALRHAEENLKNWDTIEMELFNWKQEMERSPDYFKRLSDEEWAYKMGELENNDIPGRILDSRVSARTEPESRP